MSLNRQEKSLNSRKILLNAQNLQLRYGKQPPAVTDVNLGISSGECMVLIGPNGSGKSTILRALAAAMRPFSGDVYLDGKPIHHYKKSAVARKMAYLPQSPRVPDDFTVRDLVGYGRHPHLKWNGRMTTADWAIVDDAILQTRLRDLQHRPMATLSGGERQRAWLALALAQKPEILLLDEPTTFLDISHQFDLLELVKKLNKALGLATIMVLHDLNQAARYAHTIAVLNQGRIAAFGPPEKIITERLLAEVFNIRVKVETDCINNCPYIIPLETCQR